MFMNITPRPYQQEASDIIFDYVFDKKRKDSNGIIVAPPGSGKSVIIGHAAHRLVEQRKRVLCLCPSQEITMQNHAKLSGFGYDAGIYSASVGRRELGHDVTFAMIGSITRKSDLFADYDVIFVDECHKVNAKGGMYAKLFDELGKKVIGLSATPFRMANGLSGAELRMLNRTKPRIFHDMLYVIQNKDMFDQGFLAPLEYHDVFNFDLKRLKLNTSGSDYTDLSVQEYMESAGFDRRMVQALSRLHELGKKPLVFTRFVRQSYDLLNRFKSDFPNTTGAVLTGESDKTYRTEIIQAYAEGQIDFIANVGVLDTGVDFPKCDAVMLCSPIRSLGLLMQKQGRGTRPYPNKKCMIVDMCGNYNAFGHMEDISYERDHKGLWCVFGKPIVNGVKTRRQITNKPLVTFFQ